MNDKPILIILLITLNLVIVSLLQAQYQNVKVNTSGNDPEEVSIAINPADPNNLVAGANIRYFYYSTNGGLNWVQGQLSSPLGVWGDPSIAFDLNGNAYFGHLSNPPSPGYWIDRIVVQKSTNKGANWTNGVGIGFNPPLKNQDKEWLIVDWTNSPYQNYVYTTWTEFDNYGSSNPADSTRILFSRSTDGGNTWSAPVRISDRGGDCVDEDNTVEGAVPAVGPNGEIYTSWAGPLGLVFDKSTNGGLTWGIDKVITTIPGGWDFSVPGINRCNGLPITCCDISNSPYRGNIYINWSDQRNGTSNTDIFFVKSTDGGNTWSSVKKVNQDESGRHQFFTWMTVDPATGIIYIVYYDRRAYSDNKTDVYVARSADGGETFTEFKVSQTSFTPTASVFFGDYTNITALNGKVYPMWMRMDGTTLSVWIAIIQDTISNQVTANFSTNEGWNLLSVPIQLSNKRINKIFPNASSYAYSFDEVYYILDSISVGKGFWLKFPNVQTHSLTGTQVSSAQIPLKAGWNLIGGLNGNISIATITTNPPGIISSAFYEYNGGYQETTLLSVGKGYWVKSNSDGTMNLSISSLKTTNNKIISFEKFDCIEISDVTSKSTLYLSKEMCDLNLYELPPKPPSGVFDVRFTDGRKVGLYSNKNVIELQNANFPVKVKFNSNNGLSIKLKSIITQEVFELKNNQEILITDKNSTQFEVVSTMILEKSYLAQNFPNPFNSSTTINFIVPQDDEKYNLTLKVFDLLGQELVILPNKEYKPGFYSIEFTPDNFNLSSGIYFYELTQIGKNTGRVYRETKKLNYLK